MAEKAGADPDTLARALDQPRQIGHHQLIVMYPHDSELRFQGRERVVGDLRPRVRDRRQKRRFTGIGHPDQTDIRDQLQTQPDPGLFSRPARIGAARRPVGRAFVVRVAEPTIAAAQKNDALARACEVDQDLPVLLVHDLGPDRYRQHQLAAVGAALFAPRPAPPVRRPEVLAIAVVDQGVEIIRRDKDDVAALAAIAAVRAAELDEFFAAKARRTRPPGAALQIDFALIEKLHRIGHKNRNGRAVPLGPRQLFGKRLFSGFGSIWQSRRDHRDVVAPGEAPVKANRPVHDREQGMVSADADKWARVELGAALANDDVARNNRLAAEFLDAKPPAAAIAAIA